MLTFYRSRPADFGSEFIRFPSGNLGTLTANTTFVHGLGGINDKDDTGGIPGHTAYVAEVFAGCTTAPIDADGTYLLNVVKYDSSAAAAVVLVTGFSMEGLTAGKTERVPLDTLTDSQRILDFGDYLYIELVNNSAAIDTQMVGGNVSVLCKLLT